MTNESRVIHLADGEIGALSTLRKGGVLPLKLIDTPPTIQHRLHCGLKSSCIPYRVHIILSQEATAVT